jgi:hypothetical protein
MRPRDPHAACCPFAGAIVQTARAGAPRCGLSRAQRGRGAVSWDIAAGVLRWRRRRRWRSLPRSRPSPPPQPRSRVPPGAGPRPEPHPAKRKTGLLTQSRLVTLLLSKTTSCLSTRLVGCTIRPTMRIDPGCAGEHFDHLLGSQGSGEHGAAPRPIRVRCGPPAISG